jgi:hypothetical protein
LLQDDIQTKWVWDLRNAVSEAKKKMGSSAGAKQQVPEKSSMRESGDRKSGGDRVERNHLESCLW